MSLDIFDILFIVRVTFSWLLRCGWLLVLILYKQDYLQISLITQPFRLVGRLGTREPV